MDWIQIIYTMLIMIHHPYIMSLKAWKQQMSIASVFDCTCLYSKLERYALVIHFSAHWPWKLFQEKKTF